MSPQSQSTQLGVCDLHGQPYFRSCRYHSSPKGWEGYGRDVCCVLVLYGREFCDHKISFVSINLHLIFASEKLAANFRCESFRSSRLQIEIFVAMKTEEATNGFCCNDPRRKLSPPRTQVGVTHIRSMLSGTITPRLNQEQCLGNL